MTITIPIEPGVAIPILVIFLIITVSLMIKGFKHRNPNADKMSCRLGFHNMTQEKPVIYDELPGVLVMESDCKNCNGTRRRMIY